MFSSDGEMLKQSDLTFRSKNYKSFFQQARKFEFSWNLWKKKFWKKSGKQLSK